MVATGRRIFGREELGSLLLLVTFSTIVAAEDTHSSKPIQITQIHSNGEVETVCPAYESAYFQELLVRIRAFDAPDEFFTLEMSCESGSLWVMELAVRNGVGEMRWYLPFQDETGVLCGTLARSRYFVRPISKEEIAAFRRMLVDEKIEQQPAPPSKIGSGHWYDFTHLDKNVGYRWYINNPPGLEPEYEEVQGGFNPLEPNDPRLPSVEFLRYFAKLCDPDKMHVCHRPPYLIRDMEVLYANPIEWVETVCRQDEDLAVLVRTRLLPLDARERPIKVDGWYSLADGKLTKKVDRPTIFATKVPDAWGGGQDRFYPMGEPTEGQLNRTGLSPKPMPVVVYEDHCRPWQVQFGERFIRAGVVYPYGGLGVPISGKTDTLGQRGTWLLALGQAPEKLFDDMIDRHVVTPDGRWLVGTIESQDEGETTRRSFLCYDLEHRKRAPVQNLTGESLDGVFAVCNWPDTKEVLLMRPGTRHWPEDVGSPGETASDPAFYVLNPAKAIARPLLEHASLDVWLRLRDRPLQPTSKKGVFWAALPDTQSEETVVGRLCEDAFQPGAFFRVPLLFESDDMWVDEDAKKIYVAYRGDLLRFPLVQSNDFGHE